MRQRRGGAYGPYVHRRRWRVDVVTPGGTRSTRLYETEAEALAVIKAVERELGFETGTTCEKALEEYELALKAKGNKPRSVGDTIYRIGRVLGDSKSCALRLLSTKDAERLYAKLVATPIPSGKNADGTPCFRALSADSHRNMLAETKTWARWCVAEKHIRVSPFEGVKGLGRRSRGKDQLRNDEGRRLLAECLRRETPGALGLAVALLMGMRSSEIRGRTVRDLDEGGTALWIPHGKTRSARRVLEVPSELQGPLSRLAEGRLPEELLFGGPHDRSWLRKHAQTICRAAKVPYVCPHGLRGTFTTVQLKTIGDADLTAAGLGHSGTKMALGTYAAPGTAEEIAQKRRLQVLDGGKKKGPKVAASRPSRGGRMVDDLRQPTSGETNAV